MAAYLDTCIVSGLVRGDLPAAEQAALIRLLEARKRGDVHLVTSEITKGEIGQIPEQHRRLHEIMYSLLEDVPAAVTHQVDCGLLLLGAGGGTREDPLFSYLKALLPDLADAEHVFQAAKNQVDHFLTADQRTIVKHATAVEAACGLKVVTPVKFAEILGLGSSSRRDQ